MNDFRPGPLERGALARSVGPAFRTDIPCLKTEHEMMLICKRRELLLAL